MHFLLISLILAGPLNIAPSTILTDSDQQVVFTLPLNCKEDCPETVELILWSDATKQKSKARWQMNDAGLWGDQKAGDHIYTQSAFFNEHKMKTLYFTADKNIPGEIQVNPRPTFWEMLKAAWNKAWSKKL